MSITEKIKTTLWVLLGPILVSAVFYSGIVWNKTTETDAKVNKVVSSIEGIGTKIDNLANRITSEHIKIRSEVYKNKTDIAVLDQRVDTLKEDPEEKTLWGYRSLEEMLGETN